MALSREEIGAIAEAFHDRLSRGDTDSWLELLSEDCRFVTGFMPEPIVGRSAPRTLIASWRKVLNQEEWRVVEGNRVVVGWNERVPSMKESTPSYRGISTIVLNDAELVVEYDGVFDTAAVIAALDA